jgi:REP element-mobilizing transposase RayT
MAIADHVIFSSYGFWLPNDPRGSWSDFVRSWELFRFGKATPAGTRESVAHAPHDRELRLKAKEALKFPAVVWTGVQAVAVVEGFAEAAREGGYRIYACAIMPEHVHMVIRRCVRRPKQVVGHLKARATQRLQARGMHPLAGYRDWDGGTPSPWGRKSWDVFLDDVEAVWAAIRYVENNPRREGKKVQQWGFVERPG